MSNLTLYVTKNQKQKFDIYPALILAEIVNETVPEKSIAFGYKDVDLIEKGNTNSAVGLEVDGGEFIYGAQPIIKKLLESFPDVFKTVDQQLIQNEIDRAYKSLASTDNKALTAALEDLEDTLALRTYLVGYTPTAADAIVFGYIRGSLKILGSLKTPKKVEKKEEKKEETPAGEDGKPKEKKKEKKVKAEPVMQYINIDRWMKHLEAKVPAFKKGVDAVVAIKNAQGKKGGSFIELKGTEKGVVTRFPPEPSGYMHIGHAIAALINTFAAEMYKGKLILRFDDTNPTKEKQEYADAIEQDLGTLGINFEGPTYTSDYFQQCYDAAVKLIEQGKAYCDDTEQMKMREERMAKQPSSRRDRSVEENLKIFTEEMKNATEVGQKNCLRAKISYDDNNGAMRDPVIYRCNPEPHHRTGTTWKMYPTYDFACPIVDCAQGVTHAFRTNEYNDRNPQYHWMLTAIGLRDVHIEEFARLTFVNTVLSKRHLTTFVDEGKVSGWDDPRFPTVRGIIRRGMQVEALRRFLQLRGFQKGAATLEWTELWKKNLEVIDPIAPRHTALLKDGLVTVKVEGAPETAQVEDKPKHKKNPAVGTKKTYFSNEIFLEQSDAQASTEGEELTLMDWGNAFVTKVVKDEDGKVTDLALKLHLEGDFKKTKRKITWLSTAQETVPVELRIYGPLITGTLTEDKTPYDLFNEQSEVIEKAVADVNVKELKKDDVIQFERKGYFRVDSPYEEGKEAVLINIPTV
ncbi:glutamyl-tRNA synthetase [Ascobolus immersus RN42]|uniref:glutamate--tRNA ligase n=1 Tax=Ascobolus immersus RN42 TaxID=1160509 RepID=A0A3N4HL97_ASCIM|nr:glutamyl-tRNA synthetase [Ascobolus immersus RN42]